MSTVSGAKMILAMETDQAVMVWVNQKADATAFSPITTIWASPGDSFLAAETDHTIPTVATAYVYLCSIVEHGMGNSLMSSRMEKT
jgi:hypothetical protein